MQKTKILFSFRSFRSYILRYIDSTVILYYTYIHTYIHTHAHAHTHYNTLSGIYPSLHDDDGGGKSGL